MVPTWTIPHGSRRLPTRVSLLMALSCGFRARSTSCGATVATRT
jgi:hypothetical protein